MSTNPNDTFTASQENIDAAWRLWRSLHPAARKLYLDTIGLRNCEDGPLYGDGYVPQKLFLIAFATAYHIAKTAD